MYKKFIKSILAGAAALTIGTAFSPALANAQDVEINPDVEQSINIMTIGELVTLDGMLYNDTPSSDMIGQIFEGLYRVSTGTEVELGQAESAEVSEDGLLYTFVLRDDIFWSNGDPVTAEDFVYSYQRLVDPSNENTSSSVAIFKNADAIRNGEAELDELGVRAVDEKTLEIELEYPAPYLPKLLTGSRFMPVNQAFVEEAGDAYGTSAANVVTNGPFLLEGWEGTNIEWNLVKNENYWDAENVYLENVLVSVVKETGTGADLFDAGELDYAILSDQFVGQYEGADVFNQVPKSTVGHLMFNVQGEVTSNAALRRAIGQAFDRELYAQSVIQDGSSALSGWVPVGFDVNEEGVDFREEAGDLLAFDVEAAQADWEQAKEELGMDEIEIELLVSDVDLSGRTAEYLQAQLMENLPGLSITIRQVPLQNRLELQRSFDYDIFYGTWAPDYQDAMNFVEQLTTNGGINFAGYSNEEVDALVEQARGEFANDPEQRRAALVEAERIINAEDAVAPTLYQAATSYLLSTNIENFEVLPFGRTINLRTTYVTE